MRRDLFQFDLPDRLIARQPTQERQGSRLLYLDSAHDDLQHQRFSDFLDHVQAGDLIVFNNTKVIPARLYGEKASGGKVEVLVERLVDLESVHAHVRASKSPKLGSLIFFSDNISAEMIGRKGNLFELRFNQPVLNVMDAIGHMPLPPYIDREDTDADRSRYQTVYGDQLGAVAAPTAGLHYDEQLLATLSIENSLHAVTLHVGAGTFKPLTEGQVSGHVMHAERCTVSFDSIVALAKPNQNRIATGTTTLRTLESLYWLALKWRVEGAQPHQLNQWDWCQDLHLTQKEMGWSMETAMQWVMKELDGKDWEFETAIMMVPPYRIQSVQALITNFHMPQSTLLCLVACAIGDRWQALYDVAKESNFRFLSYGDGSLLEIEPFVQ